jgi:hypothetical protein
MYGTVKQHGPLKWRDAQREASAFLAELVLGVFDLARDLGALGD